MTKFSTPYSRAWEAFADSDEFANLVVASNKGDADEYTINRIRRAFDAGWNRKTSSILDAMSQMSHKGHKEAIDER